MRPIFILLSLFFLFACSDTSSYHSVSIIENNSTHIIKKISTYSQGDIKRLVDDEIDANSEQVVFEDGGRGLGTGLTFASNGSFYDSLILTFDDWKEIVYYPELQEDASRGLAYESPRNIVNLNNWQETILLEKRRRVEREFRFVVTQGDYELAR